MLRYSDLSIPEKIPAMESSRSLSRSARTSLSFVRSTLDFPPKNVIHAHRYPKEHQSSCLHLSQVFGVLGHGLRWLHGEPTPSEWLKIVTSTPELPLLRRNRNTVFHTVHTDHPNSRECAYLFPYLVRVRPSLFSSLRAWISLEDGPDFIECAPTFVQRSEVVNPVLFDIGLISLHCIYHAVIEIAIVFLSS